MSEMPVRCAESLEVRALRVFGLRAQLIALGEECSELAAVLFRYENGKFEAGDDDLEQEWADVRIMVGQFAWDIGEAAFSLAKIRVAGEVRDLLTRRAAGFRSPAWEYVILGLLSVTVARAAALGCVDSNPYRDTSFVEHIAKLYVALDDCNDLVALNVVERFRELKRARLSDLLDRIEANRAAAPKES